MVVAKAASNLEQPSPSWMSSEYLSVNLCKQLFYFYKYDSRTFTAASYVFSLLFRQELRILECGHWKSSMIIIHNPFAWNAAFSFLTFLIFRGKLIQYTLLPRQVGINNIIILSKLLTVPDSYTLKEAELKTGSLLGLCPGKAPTSSQVTRGPLTTRPTFPRPVHCLTRALPAAVMCNS